MPGLQNALRPLTTAMLVVRLQRWLGLCLHKRNIRAGLQNSVHDGLRHWRCALADGAGYSLNSARRILQRLAHNLAPEAARHPRPVPGSAPAILVVIGISQESPDHRKRARDAQLLLHQALHLAQGSCCAIVANLGSQEEILLSSGQL